MSQLLLSATAGAVAELEDPHVPHAATGETTPLLTSSNGAQSSAGATDESRIPKKQVALLCFARLIEPIAFFSVFPYINQMVQDNGSIADTDVGFYSGVIESLFSLTQAIVMLSWGRAADRFGRKPVLVLSLIGMASATALFGTARTLGQMIAFRCLAGVFSGTIVTIRTMLAEHSTTATQARVFSWFAFSGNLGIFLGPLLGGALADPLGRSSLEDGVPDTRFFAAYPYALPGFVVAGLGFLAALLSALYIDETLVTKKAPTSSSSAQLVEETTVSEGQDLSIRHLLKSPGVAIVLYNYAHVMLLAFSYTAIVPVFWFTPVPLGGLGFTPLQISIMMGMTGAGQAVWLLFVFPPLQYRIGTNGVMRVCAIAYPVFMAVSPLASMLLRYWNAPGIFWTCVPPIMVIGSGVSMCFTAVQLAVNDVAPSPQLLGTLNALALTGVSYIRAFTPALFTSLYAVNARTQALDGYIIWVLMVLVALGYTLSARYLPDYDAIKKRRLEHQD
ncbi:major facilitator superfamily transporter [Ophiostoma piceae UAMH 11346]|uniref:Major facilitator superfamily transporter n=1 Tax=Ophiostoma piceae (strain UAMH 11346) TaxID=1262450 RepID=S3BX46_OPHP1|nr:major facilitator superfamily transporter [Ophiostoma piceae UAMH 11346]